MAIFYATVPLVSGLPKALVERVGYKVYDHLNGVFGSLGLAGVGLNLRHLRGAARVRGLAALATVVAA